MKSKTERVLSIYDRLLEGKVLVKRQEAFRYEVNDRTIQRDLDDIRAHLSEPENAGLELVYDRKKRGYVIRKTEERENE